MYESIIQRDTTSQCEGKWVLFQARVCENIFCLHSYNRMNKIYVCVYVYIFWYQSKAHMRLPISD